MNNDSTAIETESGISPLLLDKTEPPEGPVHTVRKNNCTHYSECSLKIARVKGAKNFTCDGCNSYEFEKEQPVDGGSRLTLVKTGTVAQNDGGGQASSDAQKEGPTELFEMQRPYTLMDVPVSRIDASYELNAALYKNLSVSIGLLGPLQTVILQEKGDGAYVVWAGRRRVLAAKSLGKDMIPAMVFGEDVPESLIDIYAVTENMNRASNPAQEAEALSRIMSAYRWSGEEAAKKLGIPVKQVRNRVRLMKLIPEFFKKCGKGELSLSVARKMSSLPPAKQKELLGKEKIALKEIEGVCKETKLQDLLSQDEFFVLPELAGKGNNLSEIKLQLAEIVRSDDGNVKLLQKALLYIEKYEASREET